MRDYDAVVIGAGPNGLVAANVLADAGWHVLVLEAQDRLGGAVASDSSVHDGYIHDTFSSFYPLAAASPVLKAMNLERFGLTWSHAPAVVGSPASSGGWALIEHDPQDTAEGLERLHPGDGDAWERMYTDWTHIGDALVDALLSPFPPIRAGLRALTKIRRAGGMSFIRMLLEPSRTLTNTRFGGSAAQLLIAGNAAHADIPPDAAGSGLFGWLLAMLAQDVGFPVAQGGAEHLAASLASRFTSLGGEIRCHAEVTRVQLDGGRAVGVRLADGELIGATRSVVADVSAPALYGGLVSWATTPGPGPKTDAVIPVGPRHRQGRLGAERPRPVARGTGNRTGHGPSRRVRRRFEPMDGQHQLRCHSGRPVPAHRPDDHRRSHPVARRYRGALGIYPRAADCSR